jgi:hypothetical protein
MGEAGAREAKKAVDRDEQVHEHMNDLSKQVKDNQDEISDLKVGMGITHKL